MPDDTGAERSKGWSTQGGDNKARPSTVFSNAVPPDMPAQLGRYRIKKRLGGGGMGAVYLVENTELQRLEALKVPHFESGNDPTVRERFLREARAAAGLHHPNLCPIYHADVIDGIYFLTMCYLEGKLLATYTGRPHPPREAVKLVAKLAQALEYAHDKGVIHRDLKPSNVMMCPRTGPTVMDFGLAKQTLQPDKKLTQSGMAMGTPAYMPPEQVKGELNSIGPASDVYSLGVIFFELLTGRLPFVGSTGAEVMANVLLTPNPLPSQFKLELNPGLDTVCGKAMAKKPEERYASMKEFAATLQELLRTLPAKQEGGARAAPTGGGKSEGMFDMPTVPPEPPAVPKRAPTPSKTIPAAKPVEAAKARKPGRKRQDVIAQTPPASRGLSIMVSLCLALLLMGGAVFAVFMLSRGQDGGANRAKDMGPKEFINVVGMKLMPIPGTKEKYKPKRTFTMGSPKGEELRHSDEDRHEVEVSEFYLGSCEVTVGQFQMFVKDTGYQTEAEKGDGAYGLIGGDWKKDAKTSWKNPEFAQDEDEPVTCVSWNDAKAYCEWLNKKRDEKRPDEWVYRLPREAEWEYACRGAASSYQVFHFGNTLSSTQANFNGNYPYGGADTGPYLKRTCKVGSYKANEFGLYDMHGNAWQWCADRYGSDYYGKSDGAKDPAGPVEGSDRVIRGGSWYELGQYCRSARRFRSTPADRYSYLGFRVALVPSSRGKME